MFVDVPGEAAGTGRRGALGADQPAPPRVPQGRRREGGRPRGCFDERVARARDRTRNRIAPCTGDRQAPVGLRTELGRSVMQKSFEVTGPVELEIRLASGDITVDADADGRVEVELIAHDEESQRLVDDATVELREHAGRAQVIVDVPNKRGLQPRPDLRQPGDHVPRPLSAGVGPEHEDEVRRRGGARRARRPARADGVRRRRGRSRHRRHQRQERERRPDRPRGRRRRLRPDRLGRRRHRHRPRPRQRQLGFGRRRRSARPTTTSTSAPSAATRITARSCAGLFPRTASRATSPSASAAARRSFSIATP